MLCLFHLSLSLVWVYLWLKLWIMRTWKLYYFAPPINWLFNVEPYLSHIFPKPSIYHENSRWYHIEFNKKSNESTIKIFGYVKAYQSVQSSLVTHLNFSQYFLFIYHFIISRKISARLTQFYKKKTSCCCVWWDIFWCLVFVLYIWYIIRLV